MVVITADQRDVIFRAVQAMYTEVASRPDRTFHFPTGRRACAAVGYPEQILDRLPPEAVESFAGVGYPFAANVIREGDTVLDIGSGSGTDILFARLLTGPSGRAIGLDLTAAMREKLARTAESMGVTVEVLAGDAEAIPLPDSCVDVVTSNGVINLVPDKAKAMAEIGRVLRPGGRVQIADIILETEPSAACRSKPELWAECIVGASKVDEYIAHLIAGGVTDVEVLSRHDYFANSESEETRSVAASFGAAAIVLRARKPTA